jgi:hypothetical protein
MAKGKTLEWITRCVNRVVDKCKRKVESALNEQL